MSNIIPKFKIGDRIICNTAKVPQPLLITSIKDNKYIFEYDFSQLPISKQDNWRKWL